MPGQPESELDWAKSFSLSFEHFPCIASPLEDSDSPREPLLSLKFPI